MKTTPPQTLFEAIAPNQRQFEGIVHRAVHQALVDLGDEVRKLDWASLQARLKAMSDQAQVLSTAVAAHAARPKRVFPLLYSNAWLRRRIAADPDDEPSAGGALSVTKTEYLLSKLSQMDPDEISAYVSSAAGAAELAELPVPLVRDSESLLRPWASVARASAAPFTEAQYQRFLDGKDPHGED
jgi:hypothetical protein